MKPSATPYPATTCRRDGYRGRYRQENRLRRMTAPTRMPTRTGNPARGSHHGRMSTSVRIEVRNVVAYPSQNASAAPARTGTTMLREPPISRPPNDVPATRKNIPGKYGYVTPHPGYGRATWPVVARPWEIRKYSPTSLPKYTNRVRGESRSTSARATIARREDAADFRSPRKIAGGRKRWLA